MRKALSLCVNLILPPRCLGCNEIVGRQGTLCPACWLEIQFIADACCDCCGTPFEFKTEGSLCAACLHEKPVFDRARAAIRYEAKGRELILRFKHADATHTTPAFAVWMANAGADLLQTTDLLLPVPLHWTRLFWRQYNQAALLTKELASLTQIPFHNDLLKRRSATVSQGRLTLSERKKNVRQAFDVPKRFEGRLSGLRVMVIDDVLTTGATVNECARVLKRCGAKTVDVLCLAKVV